MQKSNRHKNNDFRFKQFQIQHDRCAMKVGTDGILLGAWTKTQGTHYLDIGTGTGLLALMLAQRTDDQAQITAIEIDESAYLQAGENVRQSPWAEKIKLLHIGLEQFSQKCGAENRRFDCIVANPPYFKQGVACRSQQRELARYTTEQSHENWLNQAANCLKENGQIHFILPYQEGKTLIFNTALYCVRYCEITTKAGKPPQRLLLTFSKQALPQQRSQLVIYDEQNRYSTQFKQLTKDFYLKF
ncbi:tRNA1(Val) (adenine(37)-N6)-methyltransferase [Pasteurellaceae bacterium LIM206]|nr:tRNA1(Val) (adenine(37)-N6)-methyltransferase [Pasteurellaceae bacterium LIM206]